MSLIEKSQRKVLFNLAAKKALTSGNIRSVEEFYAELVGKNDYFSDTKQRYGSPLAPLYKAVSGTDINVSKIRKYFEVLGRDLAVSDEALVELENKVVSASLEIWARMALLKNRADELVKVSQTERDRASNLATWSFAESFTNVFYINMETTTAWIDTAEGNATLPLLEAEQVIKATDIVIADFGTDDIGGFLGSNPSMMFDGSDVTNWRTQFSSPGTKSYITINLTVPTDIVAMFFNPVGFGVNLSVEVDQGLGLTPLFSKIIYKKETIPFQLTAVKKLRLTYTTAESVLPKVCGFKNFLIYKGQSAKSAKIFSTALVPTYSFSEVNLAWESVELPGTRVSFYYSTDNTTWIPAENGVWAANTDSTRSSAKIDLGDLDEQGILYVSQSLGDFGLSANDGELSVGENQFEVSAVRLLSLAQGEYPHDPDPSDFKDKIYSRAWAGSLTKVAAASGGAVSVQVLTDATTPHPQLRKSRFLFGTQPTPGYMGVTFLPLAGGLLNSSFQTNYTYRFKCRLFADSEGFVDDGTYWFLQGFRDVGKKTFAEIGKSYGSFSIIVNGVKVAGDSQPFTLYANNTYTETSAESGRNFSFSLNKGWNDFEILLFTVAPLEIEDDDFSSENPYLQLTISPSPLDAEFKNAYNISRVSGSGLFKPVQEFDLIWSLPKDPTNWAWSSLGSRNKIVFNVQDLQSIDGYYGSTDQTKIRPNCILTYRGFDAEDVHEGRNLEEETVYVRADLERDTFSSGFPIIDFYQILTR